VRIENALLSRYLDALHCFHPSAICEALSMNASRFTTSFSAALSALALLGAVALTGCTATDLAGPDTAPPETQEQKVDDTDARRTAPVDAGHNMDTEGGTGTEHGKEHNVLPSEQE
jgi:hypothetical protein